MNVLEVNNISKQYDGVKAVDGISFAVKEGQIFGLLGPNGAGKTSTMRMIMNITAPDSGEIRLFGEPFHDALKQRIGYLPEERGLYPKMKVLDHLAFLGEMKGMAAKTAHAQARQWLERVGLAEWADKKVQELSKGMQQKVQFVGTLLHQPDLVIMDEPFSGLDPLNAKFLKDILLEYKRSGKTIILSTHLMDQAEKLCEAICLINKGRVALSGSLAEIKQKFSHNVVNLEYDGDGTFVTSLPMVERVNDYGHAMHITLKDGADPNALLKTIVEQGLRVYRFEVAETTLDEIFIDVVGGQHGQN